jgi:hypothetical protein
METIFNNPDINYNFIKDIKYIYNKKFLEYKKLILNLIVKDIMQIKNTNLLKKINNINNNNG